MGSTRIPRKGLHDIACFLTLGEVVVVVMVVVVMVVVVMVVVVVAGKVHGRFRSRKSSRQDPGRGIFLSSHHGDPGNNEFL